MTNPELRAALIAAFPPAPITRETIYTADASWARYEQRDDLGLVEANSWVELAPEVLEHHANLLVHAGGALFRAILPAYVQYLLSLTESENGYRSSLPYAVATQLTRNDRSKFNQAIFDGRMHPMTGEQRDVIRRVVAVLASHALVRGALREALSAALRSW